MGVKGFTADLTSCGSLVAAETGHHRSMPERHISIFSVSQMPRDKCNWTLYTSEAASQHSSQGSVISWRWRVAILAEQRASAFAWEQACRGMLSMGHLSIAQGVRSKSSRRSARLRYASKSTVRSDVAHNYVSKREVFRLKLL